MRLRFYRLRLRCLCYAFIILLFGAVLLTVFSSILPPDGTGDKGTSENSVIKIIKNAWDEVFSVQPKKEEDSSFGADPVKRDKIVEMIRHAWSGYEKYAWGSNEVHPIGKTAHDSSNLGGPKFGLTIIDSLDTLYIAGLKTEFEKAKKWIESSFDFSGPSEVSVFEVTIRYVGGFLSAYALTKDNFFLEKANDVASRLLPAFNTPTGIPHAAINLGNNQSHNWNWAGGSCAVLSELGTLSMEFLYLSEITGDKEYRKKIETIYSKVKALDRKNNLYVNYIDANSGQMCGGHTSVGALGDSFYEYLYKTWRLTSHQDAELKPLYDDAITVILNKLLQTSKNGNQYFAEMREGALLHKMEHLACFMGGLLALSANDSTGNNKTQYMKVADAIGETCHLAYNLTASGLGPEAFNFGANVGENVALQPNEKVSLLRPETVETYFYLWRLTHDQKWRDYGWDFVQALEKHCRVESGGYSAS